MNMREVIGDIENRNNRTLAAIERWLAVDSERMVTLHEAPDANERNVPREWHKPTLVDALAHAAAYCTEEAP